MDILITIISLFASSLIIISVFNLRLSVTLYLAYLILVPYLQFNIGGISLSYNLVNMIMLTVFIYRHVIEKKSKLNYNTLIPFLFLYLSLLVLSVLTWGMPWSIQFNMWRASIMQTCILSFVIWNLILIDVKSMFYFRQAFTIALIISGIYCLYLIKMEGSNPYTSFLSAYFGMTDVADNYSYLESRLSFSTAGKIQGTMNHPMTWTLFLCLSLIFTIAQYTHTKRKIFLPLFIFIVFNILIAGARTGIAALIIGFVYYLFRIKQFKLVLFAIILLVFASIIVNSSPDLSNLFSSFIDVSGQKSDIKGSSISMRIDQLNGAIREIKGHELTGKGYGWTGYYLGLNDTHPVLLAFESLLFMVLCNSGYLGIVIWGLFFLMIYRSHRILLANRTDILLMDTLLITFFAYAIGTGEYGYMPFYSIFYVLQMGYLKISSEASLSKNRESPINNLH